MQKFNNEELDSYPSYRVLIDSCARNYRLVLAVCEACHNNINILKEMSACEEFKQIEYRIVALSLYRGFTNNITSLYDYGILSSEDIQEHINNMANPDQAQNLGAIIEHCDIVYENIEYALLAYCFVNNGNNNLIEQYIKSLERYNTKEQLKERVIGVINTLRIQSNVSDAQNFYQEIKTLIDITYEKNAIDNVLEKSNKPQLINKL